MIFEDRLIVALDVPNMDKASRLIVALDSTVNYYKVGMELFYGAQKDVIDYLKARRKKIFLDLKLHDIPNTVARSIEVLSALEVDMITLHAFGGREMMQEAAAAAKRIQEKTGRKAPLLLAVTVLTSLGEKQWRELNSALSIKEQVLEMAKLAKDSGMSGAVASPWEAAGIREACGRDFYIVTPGVRQSADSCNDQARFATPQMALEAGASHIVVGRPITRAIDPKGAARAIIEEMREACL
ncbi:MAG: orotidine-5'-phosphate decarboxylase [Acidaminococcales bacterium]|jgi:orotidine-5'-phosphate decarboxylase|nr:orotidine-5'-phosphate decarboxylase [Acidaminococcales bacterium]MDR3348085.1 orotidine-5'-phosphate decarboxylase [Acidaminococcales bacterium]